VLAGAVALGAALAAFYLLPAVYEQRWITIGQAVSAGSRPQDNFLFVHTTDADHDAFNRLISWVALLEIIVIFVTAWAAAEWRKARPALWNSLVGWAIACSLMMFPVTTLLWRILPKLQFMQFPWRWLLCLSMIFSLLVPIALKRWWMRAGVCVLSLAVIGVAWHRIQAPWWDNASDLREMQDNMCTGVGYEGTDEYTPLGADPAAIDPALIDKDALKVTVDGPAQAAIRVLQWNEESKSFTAEMSAPDQLALRLFAYPAWQAEVNGHVVATAEQSATGQMLVPVQAGMNHVQINFVRTWDRTAGGWISLLTALCVALWIGRRRRSPA
jgi:hypothetical protein